MAAVLVAVRNRKRKARRPSVAIDDELDLTALSMLELPEEHKRKFDIVVSTLLNGVVTTRDELYIALAGEDFVRDHVPLEEVEAVEIMQAKDEIDALLSNVTDTQSAKATVKRSSSNKMLTQEPKDDKKSPDILFQNYFQIRTIDDGYNSEYCNKLVEELQRFARAARKRARHISRFRKYQKIVRKIYESWMFQAFTSALIVLNFGLSIAAAELSVGHVWSPEQDSYLYFLNNVDVLFITAFTLELVMNAFANWMMPFFQNGWNLFDIVIVGTSLVGLAPVGVPLSMMLLLRCCRVIRIFGKLKSVSKIFSALKMSILPMVNVFFIIFIVSSIYAISGVAFFFDEAPNEFSTFLRAFVAMFRITIGSVDWWFDYFPAVEDNGSVNWASSAFIISYIILVTWVFFQVSIAVLLDNFLSASNAMKLEEKIALIKEKQLLKQFKNPLDPLLLRLSKDYINDTDLSTRLEQLFKLFDTDGSGDLSSQEFQAAIKKLDFTPRIFVSDSDFIAITQNGSLLNANGRLGPAEFEQVMRTQMRLYVQSRLSSTSELWATSDQDFTTVGTLKQILIEQLRLRGEQDMYSRDMQEILTLVRELRGNNHDDVANGGNKVRGSIRFESNADGFDTKPSSRSARVDSTSSSHQLLKVSAGESVEEIKRQSATISADRAMCDDSQLGDVRGPVGSAIANGLAGTHSELQKDLAHDVEQGNVSGPPGGPLRKARSSRNAAPYGHSSPTNAPADGVTAATSATTKPDVPPAVALTTRADAAQESGSDQHNQMSSIRLRRSRRGRGLNSTGNSLDDFPVSSSDTVGESHTPDKGLLESERDSSTAAANLLPSHLRMSVIPVERSTPQGVARGRRAAMHTGSPQRASERDGQLDTAAPEVPVKFEPPPRVSKSSAAVTSKATSSVQMTKISDINAPNPMYVLQSEICIATRPSEAVGLSRTSSANLNTHMPAPKLAVRVRGGSRAARLQVQSLPALGSVRLGAWDKSPDEKVELCDSNTFAHQAQSDDSCALGAPVVSVAQSSAPVNVQNLAASAIGVGDWSHLKEPERGGWPKRLGPSRSYSGENSFREKKR